MQLNENVEHICLSSGDECGQETDDYATSGQERVTNAEFTTALGRTVNRPTALMVPGFALRTVLGEFADEGLLGGQRAIPAALERSGFTFHHNTIGEALSYATGPRDA